MTTTTTPTAASNVRWVGTVCGDRACLTHDHATHDEALACAAAECSDPSNAEARRLTEHETTGG
jgi:hypothetical protein